MLELLDAVTLVGIDGCPAFEFFGVLANVVRDQFIGHPDAGGLRLETKDDHFVGGFRDLPVDLGGGVVRVQIEPAGVGLTAGILQLDQF